MVWKRPPDKECPECGQSKPTYGHGRNIRKLCNACFNRQEHVDAMKKIGGGRCFCRVCGLTDPQILAIFDVNPEGWVLNTNVSADGRMIRTPGNNQRFYRNINNGDRTTDDLVVLCYNCSKKGSNWKRLEYLERLEEYKKAGYGFTSNGKTCLKRGEKRRKAVFDPGRQSTIQEIIAPKF